MMHLKRKRPSVFYGWWIVGASFWISLVVAGEVHFGFTAFFEPIANEFGWSYAQVALASSLRGLEMGILSPVVGLVVDRIGPRRLVFGGAIIMGLGLALLSRISNLAMFYVAFVLITMGMSACVGTALMTAIAHWFRRRVSMAMGIANSGVAVGGLLVPLATVLIDVFGWRMAIFSLGLGTCALILLLSLLLRHKPEQYGYLPDGEAVSAEIAEPVTLEQVPITESEIGLRQVLASRLYWHIAIAYMLSFMVVLSVVTHVMPYFSSIGIARGTSSLLASAMTVVTLFGRLGFGWLGDRFNKKRLAAMAIVGTGLGMLSFSGIAAGGMWLALPFIILLGIGYGGSATMLSVLVREYFGRSSFGTAIGFVLGIASIGQILGPPLAGWVFDTWGSYQGAWFGFTILVFVSSIVMATTPPATTSIRLAGIR
jgi:sugar phosphate permease